MPRGQAAQQRSQQGEIAVAEVYHPGRWRILEPLLGPILQNGLRGGRHLAVLHQVVVHDGPVGGPLPLE